MENTYLIQLKSDGFPCWHIIKASRMKEPLLRGIAEGEDVDVSTFGTILESGWGSELPGDIKAKYEPEVL